MSQMRIFSLTRFSLTSAACGWGRSEMEIFVDRTPPNITVVSGPTPGRRSPRKVTFTFIAQTGGVVGAPVNAFRCLVATGTQVCSPSPLCLSCCSYLNGFVNSGVDDESVLGWGDEISQNVLADSPKAPWKSVQATDCRCGRF